MVSQKPKAIQFKLKAWTMPTTNVNIDPPTCRRVVYFKNVIFCYNSFMKSARNKTIYINPTEIKSFQDFELLPKEINARDLQNKIYLTNSIIALAKIPSGSIDLIVADPPYNINKNFGRGSIKLPEADFRDWCDNWIEQCARILKPTGSIYICIDWVSSGMIQNILSKYFFVRNRITWKREKGRGSKNNWKNNMEDIWFATKSDNYTFNLDAVKEKKKVLAPYVDKFGEAKDWTEKNGEKFRMTHPSNIWVDQVVPFWSMPENTEHPTQKPEKLIERIILASSDEKDLVFDPFLGSGTTAVVAKKLGRKYCGFEIEKKFYIIAWKRLKKTV